MSRDHLTETLIHHKITYDVDILTCTVYVNISLFFYLSKQYTMHELLLQPANSFPCPVSLGLLRSVSRAVDLITAHFGSSRDPEEKARLDVLNSGTVWSNN